MGDYFAYEFIRLNDAERKTYISDTYRFVLDRKANAREYKELFEDKAQFDEKFSAYIYRKILTVNSDADKDAFVQFCKEHQRVCIKPRSAHRGMGVEILDVSTEEMVQQAWEKVLADKMVVE